MKFTKIMMLAGAAGIATIGGAQAADLPSKKAAPVEYVRVCSTYGAGFFYIPGTQTCIRIGGRARYEWQYSQPYSRGDSTTGSRAIGRINFDARTATEYGLLRAFVRYDVARRIGQIRSGTAARIGTAFEGSAADFAGVSQTQVDLNRAFVQLGGLLAGRSQSYFDFYAGDLELIGTTMGSSSTTNLLAYTASFGGGFSATISIEDGVERRQLIRAATAGGPNIVGFTAPGSYAGSSMPDFVGVLRLEQGWGVAQLSGAIHQVRAVGATVVNGVTAIGFAPGTQYGYALNAGVKINLPMLAAGDQLWLQATYAKGAMNYLVGNPCGQGSAGCFFGGVGGVNNTVDAVVISNGGAGSLQLTTGWGLTAAFLHNWTPTIRQAVFASYGQIDYGNGVFFAGNGYNTAFNGANGFRDSNYWTVGSNVIWSPVRDLDIGLEINYLKAEAGNGGIFSNVVGTPLNTLKSSEDRVIGRFRIQRDF